MPTKKYVYITEDNVHFHHGQSMKTYNKENLNEILNWAKKKLDDTLEKVNKEEVKNLEQQEEVAASQEQQELPLS